MLHCDIKGVADGFTIDELDMSMTPIVEATKEIRDGYEDKMKEFKKKNGLSFTELLLSIESTNKRGQDCIWTCKGIKNCKVSKWFCKKGTG